MPDPRKVVAGNFLSVDGVAEQSEEVCERCSGPGRLRESRPIILTLCAPAKPTYRSCERATDTAAPARVGRTRRR